MVVLLLGSISFSEFLIKAILYLSRNEMDPNNITSDYDKVNALLVLLRHKNFLIIFDGFESLLEDSY